MDPGCFFYDGSNCISSQTIVNGAVKRTNTQDAEEGGDSCRTMFLIDGRTWIQGKTGMSGLR